MAELDKIKKTIGNLLKQQDAAKQISAEVNPKKQEQPKG